MRSLHCSFSRQSSPSLVGIQLASMSVIRCLTLVIAWPCSRRAAPTSVSFWFSSYLNVSSSSFRSLDKSLLSSKIPLFMSFLKQQRSLEISQCNSSKSLMLASSPLASKVLFSSLLGSAQSFFDGSCSCICPFEFFRPLFGFPPTHFFSFKVCKREKSSCGDVFTTDCGRTTNYASYSNMASQKSNTM